MQSPGSSRRAARYALVTVSPLALAAGLVAAAPAHAQTWNDGTGLWGTATNWTPNTAPNSAGATATVDNGGTAEVNSGFLFQVGTLNIGTGLGGDTSQVIIENGADLQAATSIVDKNLLSFNSAGSTTELRLAGGATVTLSGGGVVQLDSTGNDIIRDATSGTGNLVNTDNTIAGTGFLGFAEMSMDNQAGGTINANNSSAKLNVQMNGSGMTNEGLMEATSGGTLQLTTTAIAQTGAGSLTANAGSTVSLAGASVSGGSLTSVGTGSLGTAAGNIATLSNVKLTSGSTYTGNNGSATTLIGTINNQGTLALHSTGSSTEYRLTGGGSTLTLTGGGAVQLDSTGLDIIRDATSGTGKLVNTNNTIAGSGSLGFAEMSMDNQASGVINANTSANKLVVQMNGSGMTNEGLMEATNGGTMELRGVAVTQSTSPTVGTILATGANSVVELTNSASVSGGDLTNTSGGTLITAAGNIATLSNVKLTSGSTYTGNNGSATLLVGTINNQGTLALNSTGNTTEYRTGSAATLTLTGGGTVALDSSGNDIIRDASAGTGKLVNVNNTIQGTGALGFGEMSMDNQASGVVNANVSGKSLTVQMNPSGVTNEGLMEATGGGILTLSGASGGAISQTGAGKITSGAGSTVSLVSSQLITGGTLNGAGTLQTAAGNVATLDSLTIASGSAYTGQNGSDTFLVGTIHNQGTLALNSTVSTTEYRTGSAATLTLTGGGTVALDSTGNDIIRDASAGTGKLVNVNNTIQGTGALGFGEMSMDNQASGVVNANVSGKTLTVQMNPSGMTNEGLMEATGGGVLALNGGSGGAITQTGAGSITAGAGSTVSLVSNQLITGGTLNGAGTLQTVAGNVATLDSLTIASGSAYTGQNGSITFLVGTINNQGTLALNSTGNSTEYRTGSAATLTLTGGGTVALDSSGNDIIRDASAGAGKLVNVDNKIQGTGALGFGEMSIDNQASGVVNANVSGKTLDVEMNGSGISNEGLLEATHGGTLTVSGNGNKLTDTGMVFVASGAHMSVGDVTGFNQTGPASVTQVDGTLTAPHGYNLQAGVLKGTGTVIANVNNSGGAVAPGDSPGILSISGNYTQGSGGAFDELLAGLTAGTGYSQLDVTGSASLDGLIDVTTGSGFTLALGDTFTVMLFGGSSGNFASFDFNGGSCASGGVDVWNCMTSLAKVQFTEAFGANFLNLDVTQFTPIGPPPVPEPSTWAMMGIGFAGLGFMAYRSRKTASAVA